MLGLGWFAPHCSPCFLGKKTWVSRIAAQIHDTFMAFLTKKTSLLATKSEIHVTVLCLMIQLQVSKTILHTSLHHVFINFLRGSHRAEPCKKISVVGWEP